MKRQTLILTLSIMAAGLSACAPMGSAGSTSGGQASGYDRAAAQGMLRNAIAAPTRSAANVQRDRYRHPYETLSFFGVEPDDTVVEIWPGGGWYTEILAPYLRQGGGTYYAVAGTPQLRRVTEAMTANPQLYGQIRTAAFPARTPADARVPAGTADAVLTFRNVHNWIMGSGNNDQDFSADAFAQMFAMLKPGGVLGVVDHRLPESGNPARERSSGYIRTSTVRRLAEAAGFEFVRASEVNANPRDTADYPQGVWTLPPSLRLGDADRARYTAIGESDRMTLMFRRPM